MSIGQGTNAIIQSIAFIIKSVETCFIDFYSPQDVIHRLEGTEGAWCGYQRFQDIQKLIVSNFLFYVRLFCPLSSDFALFRILWDQ